MKHTLFLLALLFAKAFGQDLAQLWNVSGASLAVNNATGLHTISFTHGLGDGEYTLSIYTETCRTGGGDLLTTPATLGLNVSARVGAGADTWFTSSYDFSFEQTIMTTSAISAVVTDGAKQTATVKFCAVFDSSASAGNGGAIVNFEQLAITMVIEFDGSFTVQDFSAQVRDPAQDEGQGLSYSVTAAVCGLEGALTVNQGQVVPICICTTGFPAVAINRASAITYTGTGGITQAATNEDGIAQFLTNIINPYTEGMDAGSSCIRVETLPAQPFYQSGAAAITVTVSGSVVLQFQTIAVRERNLRALSRTLQEEQVEPFQLNLVLLADGSGAEYWSVVLVPLMAAAVGAVL